MEARAGVASRTRRSRRRASVPARERGTNARPRRPARRASRTARRTACTRRAGHRCAARGGRPRSSVEAKRADLVQHRYNGLLLAALGDLPLELLERAHPREPPLSLLFFEGDVDEADAVLEPEGRVAKAVRLCAVQLLVHRTYQLLVLGDPVGLELVADHD